jgi:hypothetical protein
LRKRERNRRMRDGEKKMSKKNKKYMDEVKKNEWEMIFRNF